MSTSTSPAGPSPPAARREFLRWQGVLGKLGRYPVLTALTALVCLTIIVVAAYALYPQVRATYRWRKAQQALARHDYEEAKAHLRYCLDVWPTSYETAFVLARTCRRNGEFEAARKHLRAAEQLPHAVIEELDLEQLMLRAHEGAVREVEEPLRNYASRTSDRPTMLLIFEALANGYMQTFRLKEADQWLGAWVKHDSDNWYPYYLRALTLEMNRQRVDTVEEYRLALERRPDHAPILQRFADGLVDLGQYEEALGHYETLLRLRPEDPAPLLGLARGRHSLGQSQAAAAHLDRLLARYPDHAGALHFRGQMLREQDRLKESLAYLRRAKALAPYEIDITFSLAKTLRDLGQGDEAARLEKEAEDYTLEERRLRLVLSKMIERPLDADLRYEAGSILMHHGKELQGVRLLLTALQEQPQHQPSHKALAGYFEKIGDKVRADYHRRRAGPDTTPAGEGKP